MAQHDCFTKARTRLMKEDPAIKWVKFDLSTIGTSDGKKVNMTGQRIEYGFIHKKKDGSEIEKQQKSFITHVFCPFCGKKY